MKLPHLAGAVLVTGLLTTACAPDGPGIQGVRERGTIRFLQVRFEDFDQLPRQGLAPQSYRRLAEEFATTLGVDAQWRRVERLDELVPALLAGDGDVIVTNLPVSQVNSAHVAFTLPVMQVSQWVLARKGTMRVARVADLAGLSFGAVVHSSEREAIRALGLPQARVIELPAGTRPEALVAQLSSGAFDVALIDDETARPLLDTHEDIERVLTLPRKRNLAWAVRPDSPDLLAALNGYITAHHLTGGRRRIDPQDLPGIRARGRLRMVTIDGPASYYLWRGELMGFDYELMQRFARHNHLELEIVLAGAADQLVPWLLEGRGDVIAAAVTITPQREARGIRFTRPYLEVDEVIVSRSDGPPIADVDDLAGHSVTVNPVAVYGDTLAELAQRRGIAIEIETSAAQTDELIEAVASGAIDLTVADSHVAALEAEHRPELRLGPVLKRGAGLGFAVRIEQTELLAALNDFIRREYRGNAYGALHSKYFRNERRMRVWREQRVQGRQLSPFDEVIKPIAARYQFDWRLIVAQMYEESEFDPLVHSPSGARGLMQIVPRTAVELGVDPEGLADPAVGIEAGVRYLEWVRSRFPETLPVADRLWFSLAAYNAGPGHVQDARILARRQGWDADRWFGSVDRAMVLLGKREFARKARHGYVRGVEPVTYVAAIKRRYQAYVDHLDAQRDTSVQPPEKDPRGQNLTAFLY
jgi:membrane-bound lytic murein transglycosylase F